MGVLIVVGFMVAEQFCSDTTRRLDRRYNYAFHSTWRTAYLWCLIILIVSVPIVVMSLLIPFERIRINERVYEYGDEGYRAAYFLFMGTWIFFGLVAELCRRWLIRHKDWTFCHAKAALRFKG